MPGKQDQSCDSRNRLLGDLSDNESRGYRITWLITASIFVGLFGYMTLCFWAPAHSGVDQNGYLVGGRQYAHSLTTKFIPATPYEYVGNMWVMVGDKPGVYYPKYPLGMPILYAIMLWIGGAKHGVVWAFYISPAGMIAAVAGMFFLGRALAGSFAGLLSAMLLAFSQVMLVLANNPNSHAACVGFVVWGMFFLLRWWQTQSIWRGLLAGFFLGFACLIRYTEGLLVLPLAFAVLWSISWHNHSNWRLKAAGILFILGLVISAASFWLRRSFYIDIAFCLLGLGLCVQWKRFLWSIPPAVGWLIPVGYLLIFNKIAMGSWTGYDTTNESGFAEGSFAYNFFFAEAGKAAFTWAKVVATWEQVVRTFHDTGMLFSLPLGLAGIAMVFRRSWQFGIVLLLWLIPGVLLYASYYWSPDRGVSYARFFVTFFPVLTLGAAVCIRHGIIGSDDFGLRRKSIAMPIAAGLVVALAVGIGAYRAALGLEDGSPSPNQSLAGMHRQYTSLAVAGDVIHKNIPDNAVVFADGPRMAEGMMNYGQFMGRFELYQFNAFTDSVMRAFLARREPDPNDPNPLQQRRRDYMTELYKSKTQKDLYADQQGIVKDALAKGRRVFVLGTKASSLAFEQQFFPGSLYQIRFVTRWGDQVEPMFGKTDAPKAPDGRWRGGVGGNPRRFGPGGPNARGGFNDWTNNSWQLVEIVLRPPPTTQPE